MENKTWHSIPKETKESWGQGPWVSEPDKVQWLDEASGLPCLIVRGPMGALCGYVGVPEGHPFFKKKYGDCARVDAKPRGRDKMVEDLEAGFDAKLPNSKESVKFPKMPKSMTKHMEEELTCGESYCPHTAESMCTVHGGITFSGLCQEPTKQRWEMWRKRMLACKKDILTFPRGDSARMWKEEGHLVDDFKAWVEWEIGTSICHLVEKKEDDYPVWWLGFDCSHSGDVAPKMDSTFRELEKEIPTFKDPSSRHFGREYRTVEYVREECTNLAAQLGKIDRLAVEEAKRDW